MKDEIYYPPVPAVRSDMQERYNMAGFVLGPYPLGYGCTASVQVYYPNEQPCRLQVTNSHGEHAVYFGGCLFAWILEQGMETFPVGLERDVDTSIVVKNRHVLMSMHTDVSGDLQHPLATLHKASELSMRDVLKYRVKPTEA